MVYKKNKKKTKTNKQTKTKTKQTKTLWEPGLKIENKDRNKANKQKQTHKETKWSQIYLLYSNHINWCIYQIDKESYKYMWVWWIKRNDFLLKVICSIMFGTSAFCHTICDKVMSAFHTYCLYLIDIQLHYYPRSEIQFVTPTVLLD